MSKSFPPPADKSESPQRGSQFATGGSDPSVVTPAHSSSDQSLEGSSGGLRYIPSCIDVGTEQSSSSRTALGSKAPPGDTDQFSNPSDVCAVAIFCPVHRKLALTEMEGGKGLWIPWSPFDLKKDVIESILNELIRKAIDVPSCKLSLCPTHHFDSFIIWFNLLIRQISQFASQRARPSSGAQE